MLFQLFFQFFKFIFVQNVHKFPVFPLVIVKKFKLMKVNDKFKNIMFNILIIKKINTQLEVPCNCLMYTVSRLVIQVQNTWLIPNNIICKILILRCTNIIVHNVHILYYL